MILASCIDNGAGRGAKGAHAVISLAEGGIRLAFPSSSLVSVFHMFKSSTRSSLRTVPALHAYMPRTAPTDGSSYTLHGLIAWKDILFPLEIQYPPPASWQLSSIGKACSAHPPRLLFRQVLLFLIGQFLAPHPKTNALKPSVRAPYCTPFKQLEDMSIPDIIITPPPPVSSYQASVNMVPTPQNAAFGNQLVVPDPEFTVINRWRNLDPWDEFGSAADDPSFGEFGGRPSPCWGDPGDAHDVVECAFSEETEIEDASTLGLGPTWSG